MILVGVMVLPMSLTSSQETRNELVAEREFLVFPDWVISAHFNKGQKLLVFFSDPTRPGEDTIPDDSAIIFVNVTDPNGGVTRFNLTFLKTTVELSVMSNDGGLLIEEPLAGVVGVAQYDGEYTAQVYTWVGLVGFYYRDGTMRRLDLVEVIEKINHPYLVALPVGASLVAVGVVLVILGARSRKRRSRLGRARPRDRTER